MDTAGAHAKAIIVSSSSELAAVLKTATGGETIYLKAGAEPYDLSLSKVNPASNVTLTSFDPDHPAVFETLKLNASSNITVDNVVFSSANADRAAYLSDIFVTDSAHITIKNSTMIGTATEYNDGKVAVGEDAVKVRNTDGFVFENNEVSHYNFGVQITGSKNVVVSGNDIHSLQADGLQFAEVTNVLIEDNKIHDFLGSLFSINHTDMIQFWTSNTTTPSSNISIINNVLDSGTGSWTQAIFMGNEAVKAGAGAAMYYQNVLIAQNTITNDTWHGITVYEANGLQILDNKVSCSTTATHQELKNDGIYIIVADKSTNVVLDDNIADKFQMPGSFLDKGNMTTAEKAAADAAAAAAAAYIKGTAGNDTMTGNDGINKIEGFAGNDTIDGKGGDDLIYGGDGNDFIYGSAGNNVLYGDAGNDRVEGGDGNDAINGGSGNDTLYGYAGNDTIRGDAGNDIINGGTGDDVLFGADGNDIIHGDAGHDAIYGDVGNDVIYGDAGNDMLFGGEGNDSLYGGDGDDVINGDAANDYVDAGTGNDIVYGGDGIDKLFGGDGNDTIFGGNDGDHIEGGNGIDMLYGENGDDTMRGGDGNDFVSGGAGADGVNGGAGNDIIIGGDGNDMLWGEDGDDILSGGRGKDSLIGGAGHDIFLFDTAPDGNMDAIKDFEAGSDLIGLSKAVFTAFESLDEVGAGNFANGYARDADDFLIYRSGTLYYDADGNGAGEAVVIANMAYSPALNHDSFIFV